MQISINISLYPIYSYTPYDKICKTLIKKQTPNFCTRLKCNTYFCSKPSIFDQRPSDGKAIRIFEYCKKTVWHVNPSYLLRIYISRVDLILSYGTKYVKSFRWDWAPSGDPPHRNFNPSLSVGWCPLFYGIMFYT